MAGLLAVPLVAAGLVVGILAADMLAVVPAAGILAVGMLVAAPAADTLAVGLAVPQVPGAGRLVVEPEGPAVGLVVGMMVVVPLAAGRLIVEQVAGMMVAELPVVLVAGRLAVVPPSCRC